MSYYVLADGTALSSPYVENMALKTATVTLEANKAGSFSFTMMPDHPYYNSLVFRQTLITVYQDGEVLFEGVPVREKINFNNSKTIECEGELSFLNDTIQRQVVYTGKTVTELLTAFLAAHNAQCDNTKQFTLGTVGVTTPTMDRYTNYETTMAAITQLIMADYGGYLRVRHSGGVRYLDYLAGSPHTSTQVVSIGRNLMDLVQNTNSQEICTVLIPLGAKTGNSLMDGLEERLTVASVNSGNDYIISTSSAIFGYIWKTVTWDDITSASDLLTEAQAYLTDAQWANLTIEAKAIDLGLLDNDVEQLRILDTVRVVSTPHGVDRSFILTKLQLDLNHPGNTKIALGTAQTHTISHRTAANAQKIVQDETTIQVEAAETASGMVTDFSATLDDEDIFNRLTDNGTIQGIFKDPDTGDLYINGQFIQAATIRADSIETTQGVSWVDTIATLLANASASHPVAIGDWEAYGSGSQFTLVKTASPKVFVRFIPATVQVTKASDNVPVDAYIIFYDGTKWYALYKLAGDAAYISEINNPN